MALKLRPSYEINAGHNGLTAPPSHIVLIGQRDLKETGAASTLGTTWRAVASCAARTRTRAMRPTSKANPFMAGAWKKKPRSETGISGSHHACHIRACRGVANPPPQLRAEPLVSVSKTRPS